MKKFIEERENKFKLNIQFFAEDVDDDEEEEIEEEEIEEEGKEEEQKKKTGENKKTGNNGKGTKSFSQSELTRKFTREKNQGRRSAFRDLGIDEKDTETINAVKKFLSERKTPEQVAAEAQAASDERIRAAEEKAMKAEIKAEALGMGAKPEYVDDIVTLVMSSIGEDDEVKDIVSEYKTKYKSFFTVDDDDEDSQGKRGTGSTIESKKKTKARNSSIGSRLAKARIGNNGKADALFGKK